MSDDLVEFIHDEKLSDVILLGHSMGGKTCMTTALQHPELISKLIVADIAPRYYEPHHSEIINALKSVDLATVKSRSDVEKIIAEKISEKSTLQFLLKNLHRKHDSYFEWRFNLLAIEKNIDAVGQEITSDYPFSKPVMFIKGEYSNYILEHDHYEIKMLFPDATITSVPDAGHWVHADNPKDFFDIATNFILR
jgi:pimeloyl-ACP methyl ester carboxylesterase